MNTIAQKLAAIAAFAGIPSYDRMIAAYEAQLSDTEGVTQEEFTDAIEGLEDDIEGKVEAVLGLARPIYHLGGALGNDGNNGETEATPKASLAGLFAVMDLSAPNRIKLSGDVVVDETITVSGGFANLNFYCDAGDDFELKVSDGGAINFGGGANLVFQNLIYTNDKNESGATMLVTLSGGIRYINCEIAYTEQALLAQSALFYVSPFVSFLRTSTITEASAEDFILSELVDSGFSNRRAVTG